MEKRSSSLILMFTLSFALPAAAQTYDGPAELPLSVPSSTYPDSCSYSGPGEKSPDACGFNVVHIANSGNAATNFTNLQNALDTPACGASGLIIALAPGAQFAKAGAAPVQLQYPGCNGHWIIVRSDVTDSSLPKPMTRITPSYLSSMATIVGQQPNGTTITDYTNMVAGHGANHYWLGPGLEVTYQQGGPYVYDLIGVGENGETNANQLPDHITVDRCYVHGPDQVDDTHVGIAGDATNIVIINNYISGVHQVDNESHGLLFFNTPGPGLVENNYVEAGAQSILVGGADPPPGVVTSDFTITNNYFVKPTQYWQGSESYNGVDSMTKNHVELKFAQRFLFDGNVFDYNWCCFTQSGPVLVMIPMNQNNHDSQAVDQDITFRYNLAQHAMTAMVVATTSSSAGNSYPNSGERRFSIHDNIFSDISGSWSQTGLGTYADGVQTGLLSIHATQAPLAGTADSITIDHNTVVGTDAYGTTMGNTVAENYPFTHFVFTNNILYWGQAVGAALGHGFYQEADGCPTIEATAPGGTWAGNTIVGTPTANQSAYTTGCLLSEPRPPLLVSSTEGGTIPDNTTIYVRATYTGTASKQTLASSEVSAPARWKADASYTQGQCIEDSNRNEECAYNSGTSGGAEPVWPTSPMEAETSDGKITWLLYADGFYGTITTGSSGSNANKVTVTLPIRDGGPEAGWNVYASKSAGSETLQNSSPLGVGASYTLTQSPTSTGSKVPGSNTLSVTAPNWSGWVASWTAVQFTDMTTGNYSLLSTSPLKGKGTNGSDPGANYSLVTSHTAPALSGID